MNTIRWGIIGFGRFGAMHARALSDLPGVELTAVCTRTPSRLEQATAQFGFQRSYTDYRRLLDDPELDVVDITTHWQQHAPIALAALASGKHVLLEKPMAATSDDCRRLLAAASEATGFFMVGHICRFDPRISLAKQACDEGRIGRVVSMHARRNLRRAAGNLRLDKISPLMGDGVHDADLMMWFLGAAPDRVYGRTVRVDQFKYADIGWAMLQFGTDAIGVVETVWRLPENTPFQIDARMEVIGTDGALYINCGQPGLAVNDTAGWHYPDTVYWPTQHGQTVGALAHELSYFAECVRSGRPPDVITPEEAARAVTVIEAAEQSAATGEVVRVPGI